MEVVGSFVKLKKRGTNYIGLCPFHNEKSPSFSVSPSKEIYKCFGCGKSGNSISFLMEHEKSIRMWRPCAGWPTNTMLTSRKRK
ncbi:CHC2 zinc finger domain-containing protein [Paraflavitalea speifideaquila]|uniref:CHC2 zinc finger domain-containing protein n=1 Tax=Paraflavitalea speifideaquila TaxID=3076558 RepID=UPI0028EF48B0|nr:CHC2 zinc finger domain-containing protein [Paraflavitalea speifideiaquila]